MALHVSQHLVNGNGLNGHTPAMPLPRSRKAFARGLPLRVATIESHLEEHDRRVDDCAIRVAALEAKPATVTVDPTPGPNNAIATAVRVIERLQHLERLQQLDKRVAKRSRRLFTISVGPIVVTFFG